MQADINAIVGADTRLLDEQLRKLAAKPYKLNFSISQDATGALGKIRSQLGEFDRSLAASNARVLAFGASAGAMYGVTRSLKEMVRVTVDVEQKMTSINSILQAGRTEFQKFGNSLFKIARDTSTSFEDVAGAAEELARQGLGIEDTLKRTSSAMKLAKVSGIEAKTAVEAITAALNSYNDVLLDSEKLVNKLVAVDAKFSVSAGGLVEAIKRVGSVASDAGLDIDNLIASITSAQQTTARGEAVIGNALKTIFTRAQRPKVLEDFEALGISTKNAVGNIRPLSQVLVEVAKRYDDLSSAQQQSVSELVGGVYQINILKALFRDLGKETSYFGNALLTSQKATNQADARLAELNQTLDSLFKKFTVNLTQVGSLAGQDVFAPLFKTLLKSANVGLEQMGREIQGESGQFLGKSLEALFKGLGNTLNSPILIGGFVIVTRFLMQTAREGREALKTLAGLNSSMHSLELVTADASEWLKRNPKYLQDIVTASKSAAGATRELAAATAAYNAEKAKSVTFDTTTRGIAGLMAAQSAKQYGAFVAPIQGRETFQYRKKAAVGLIPQAEEMAGAYAGGYTPGQVKDMNVPGMGKVFYNTAEKVKQFPGMTQPAIMPPQNSRAGRNYERDFSERHGFNPYTAASGLVPNFAPNPELQRAFLRRFYTAKRGGKYAGGEFTSQGEKLRDKSPSYSLDKDEKAFLRLYFERRGTPIAFDKEPLFQALYEKLGEDRADLLTSNFSRGFPSKFIGLSSLPETRTTVSGSINAITSRAPDEVTKRQLLRLAREFDYPVEDLFDETKSKLSTLVMNSKWERSMRRSLSPYALLDYKTSGKQKENVDKYLKLRNSGEPRVGGKKLIKKSDDYLFRGVSLDEITNLRRLGQVTSLGASNADDKLGTFITSSFGKAAGFGAASLKDSGQGYVLALDKKRILDRATAKSIFDSEEKNTIKAGRIEKDDVLAVVDLKTRQLRSLEEFAARNENVKNSKIKLSEIRRGLDRRNYGSDFIGQTAVENRIILEQQAEIAKSQKILDSGFAYGRPIDQFTKERLERGIQYSKKVIENVSEYASVEVRSQKESNRRLLNSHITDIRMQRDSNGEISRLKSILNLSDSEILSAGRYSMSRGLVPNFAPSLVNPFNKQILSSFSKEKDLLKYVQSLGFGGKKGSSRLFVPISQRAGVKIALNPAGIAQNEVEFPILNSDYFAKQQYSDILPQGYGFDENNFRFGYVERLTPPTSANFKAITGKSQMDFLEKNLSEVEEKMLDFIGNYGLIDRDFTAGNNTGIDKQGRLKLLDIGFNDSVRNNFYNKGGIRDLGRFNHGLVPNFGRKHIDNIIKTYKESFNSGDAIRFSQAELGQSYYRNTNSELNNLSKISGIKVEKLAYSLAALSGNTNDLLARKALSSIAQGGLVEGAVLPANIEKAQKIILSSGDISEMQGLLGSGAKTQNFAQALLLSKSFSGAGKYKSKINEPAVMDSWAIYVRNGGALQEKYNRSAVSDSQKKLLFKSSARGYKYYNSLTSEYKQAADELGVSVSELQGRTWGWARGQQGSRTRNAFSSGLVPNFAEWSRGNEVPESFRKKYPASQAQLVAGRMYSPAVRSMLQNLQKGGNLDRNTLEQLIERDIPIREIVAPSSINDLPSLEKIRKAVNKNQSLNVGNLGQLKAGSSISVRQDVPAMTNYGVGVVKVEGGKDFKTYEPMVRFLNPSMVHADKDKQKSLEKISLGIGAGDSKVPLLKISGTLSADQTIPSDLKSWTQVGFNPDRHSYYYDRKTGKPVVGGDEALQIGNTVFIRKPKYGNRENFLYSTGLIPNFSPLSAAISRESQSVNPSIIRVGSHSALRGPGNPDGLGVYNLKDEPLGLGQGVQRARAMGLNPKTHGIPNYAADSWVGKQLKKRIGDPFFGDDTSPPPGNQFMGAVALSMAAPAISTFGGNNKASKVAEEAMNAMSLYLTLSTFLRGPKGKAAAGITAILSGALGSFKQFGNSFNNLDKEIEELRNNIQKASSGLNTYSQTLEQLQASYLDSNVTSDKIGQLQKRLAESLSSLPADLRQQLIGAKGLGATQKIIGDYTMTQETKMREKEFALGLSTMLNERTFRRGSVLEMGEYGTSVGKEKLNALGDTLLRSITEEGMKKIGGAAGLGRGNLLSVLGTAGVSATTLQQLGRVNSRELGDIQARMVSEGTSRESDIAAFKAGEPRRQREIEQYEALQRRIKGTRDVIKQTFEAIGQAANLKFSIAGRRGLMEASGIGEQIQGIAGLIGETGSPQQAAIANYKAQVAANQLQAAEGISGVFGGLRTGILGKFNEFDTTRMGDIPAKMRAGQSSLVNILGGSSVSGIGEGAISLFKSLGKDDDVADIKKLMTDSNERLVEIYQTLEEQNKLAEIQKNLAIQRAEFERTLKVGGGLGSFMDRGAKFQQLTDIYSGKFGLQTGIFKGQGSIDLLKSFLGAGGQAGSAGFNKLLGIATESRAQDIIMSQKDLNKAFGGTGLSLEVPTLNEARRIAGTQIAAELKTGDSAMEKQMAELQSALQNALSSSMGGQFNTAAQVFANVLAGSSTFSQLNETLNQSQQTLQNLDATLKTMQGGVGAEIRAGGNIPISAAATEKMMAKAGGYNPGYIRRSGNLIYNSAESVSYLPGVREPIISPPPGSLAGFLHRKQMNAAFGFAAVGGPSIANIDPERARYYALHGVYPPNALLKGGFGGRSSSPAQFVGPKIPAGPVELGQSTLSIGGYGPAITTVSNYGNFPSTKRVLKGERGLIPAFGLPTQIPGGGVVDLSRQLFNPSVKRVLKGERGLIPAFGLPTQIPGGGVIDLSRQSFNPSIKTSALSSSLISGVGLPTQIERYSFSLVKPRGATQLIPPIGLPGGLLSGEFRGSGANLFQNAKNILAKQAAEQLKLQGVNLVEQEITRLGRTGISGRLAPRGINQAPIREGGWQAGRRIGLPIEEILKANFGISATGVHEMTHVAQTLRPSIVPRNPQETLDFLTQSNLNRANRSVELGGGTLAEEAQAYLSGQRISATALQHQRAIAVGAIGGQTTLTAEAVQSNRLLNYRVANRMKPTIYDPNLIGPVKPSMYQALPGRAYSQLGVKDSIKLSGFTGANMAQFAKSAYRVGKGIATGAFGPSGLALSAAEIGYDYLNPRMVDRPGGRGQRFKMDAGAVGRGLTFRTRAEDAERVGESYLGAAYSQIDSLENTGKFGVEFQDKMMALDPLARFKHEYLKKDVYDLMESEGDVAVAQKQYALTQAKKLEKRAKSGDKMAAAQLKVMRGNIADDYHASRRGMMEIIDLNAAGYSGPQQPSQEYALNYGAIAQKETELLTKNYGSTYEKLNSVKAGLNRLSPNDERVAGYKKSISELSNQFNVESIIKGFERGGVKLTDIQKRGIINNITSGKVSAQDYQKMIPGAKNVVPAAQEAAEKTQKPKTEAKLDINLNLGGNVETKGSEAEKAAIQQAINLLGEQLRKEITAIAESLGATTKSKLAETRNGEQSQFE